MAMGVKRIPGSEQTVFNRATLRTDKLHQAQENVMDAVSKATPKHHEIENFQRYAGFGIGIASLLTENVLSHPLIAFRRQCQVNCQSFRYHLTPFTVIQVMTTLQGNQGFTALWKGIPSTIMVQGLGMVTETVISEVTPFPKDIHSQSSLKQFAGHVILKVISSVITLPVYAASLVETVQSEIASERPGPFDCLREGFCRVTGWGVPHTARMMPLLSLVVPATATTLVRYILTSAIQYTTLYFIHQHQRKKYMEKNDGTPPARSMLDAYFPELFSAFTGHFIVDMALFPVETVLHRLLLQGTRTIIDNTDDGLSVLPITTQYYGFWDCFTVIHYEEGVSGFYKGFGALLLQYAIHAVILKSTKFVYTKLAEEFGMDKS
ncbi:solute carrier family 25 member 46-like [Anneissia japonica]|uniref:solute carrier family 25 member 46-like n=1 Tax=Anneissia japonica TaxID=1529436 RepID=UPI001425AA1C|nr:solute carrier family 25 member 46-like [Anneissia japonica]